MDQLHRALGRAHAELFLATRAALRRDEGQGTVEYVALMLLVAGLLTAVIAVAKTAKGDGIATSIIDKLQSTIEGVGDKGK